MAKWVIKKEQADLVLMAQVLHINQITAQVLVNRGVRTKNTAIKYLNPDLKFLHPSGAMKDMEAAIQIIIESIELCEKIAIYGDYDVDGVMSTVILYKTLKSLGADVTYYVPHREEEGYGLNSSAVLKLKEAEIDLILTCDNGISALAEVLEIKRQGMKIIILDHHEPGFVVDDEKNRVDVIPFADAVIDPKQSECTYPFKGLCAGGISYKFARSLLEAAHGDVSILDELLVLASLATICDIVDLKDENRIIAKKGMEILNQNKEINAGLLAIIKEKNLFEKTIGAFEFGFLIGPCINASGRLETATIAIELFLSNTVDKTEELAKKLIELNDERKAMTAQSVDEVVESLAHAAYKDDKILVILNKETHESIAGIVAGRLKEKLYRPVIVLTQGEEEIKGSARSIESYNIFDALYENRHLFIRFGGHSMAAGLSMREENIDTLRKNLNSQCDLTEDDFVEIIKIDSEVELSEVTYNLAMELKMLEPFGKENREPLFETRNLVLQQLRVIEEKSTMIISFPVQGTDRLIKAVCFGKVERFKEQLSALYDTYTCDKILKGVLRNSNLKMDIIYSIEINMYNDNASVQLKIKDFKISNDVELIQ